MSNVLTSGKVQKAAGDIARLPMDFGEIPPLIAAASLDADDNLVMAVNIATKNVVATGPGSGESPVTVSAVQLDYPYQVSAKFGGGDAGVSYNVTYTVVLDDADGTQISRTGPLEIL